MLSFVAPISLSSHSASVERVIETVFASIIIYNRVSFFPLFASLFLSNFYLSPFPLFPSLIRRFEFARIDAVPVSRVVLPSLLPGFGTSRRRAPVLIRFSIRF